MTASFKVGDHVSWSSDVGHVTGKVVKVHKKDVTFMGKARRATSEEPQYEVRSDKTGAHAMHHAAAMKKV
jgi:hypothetical protein